MLAPSVLKISSVSRLWNVRNWQNPSTSTLKSHTSSLHFTRSQEKETSTGQFQSLLEALDAFREFNLIFTKANADTDGRAINRLIDEYAEKWPNRCLAATSLGVSLYLSAMKHATAVIGNSSSGIIEAPSFQIPTVNIGDRQKGRVQAASILNCSPETNAIRQTIINALSPSFQQSLFGISNPYDRPGTCSIIVGLLEKVDIFGITKKTFHNVERARHKG